MAKSVGQNGPSGRPVPILPGGTQGCTARLGAENDEFFALDRGLQQHPPEWDRVVTRGRPPFSGRFGPKTGCFLRSRVSVYPQILLRRLNSIIVFQLFTVLPDQLKALRPIAVLNRQRGQAELRCIVRFINIKNSDGHASIVAPWGLDANNIRPFSNSLDHQHGSAP